MCNSAPQRPAGRRRRRHHGGSFNAFPDLLQFAVTLQMQTLLSIPLTVAPFFAVHHPTKPEAAGLAPAGPGR